MIFQSALKKLIIISSLIILLLGASCSKRTNLEPTKGAKKINVKLPDVMSRNKVDPNTVFTVSRDGQVATIDILVDFSACKRILVKRNATGINKDLLLVGDLPPKRRQLIDTLPGADMFYYWLVVYPPTGKPKEFGPIRVGPDATLKGTYSDVAETYRWRVARTYTSATISWDFPEAKYSRISIKRNTSVKMGTRKEVYATKVWNGTFTDAFPDPEADYWYWIDIKINNKNIISQGPFKAAYPTN